MATAPTPGAARKRRERNKAFVIEVDGKPARLYPADLGPADARRVRRLDLGYSLAQVMDSLTDVRQADIDVVCLLWWLARVKAGETDLTFEQAESEFPSYEDLADRAEFSVELDDDDEDPTPEA